jgi:hypothetical protein
MKVIQAGQDVDAGRSRVPEGGAVAAVDRARLTFKLQVTISGRHPPDLGCG